MKIQLIQFPFPGLKILNVILQEHGGKLHTSEGNRVSMIEKFSGRLVAGTAAPVVTQLAEWILKNPSFQVLVSG